MKNRLTISRYGRFGIGFNIHGETHGIRSRWRVFSALMMVLFLVTGCLRIAEEDLMVSHRDNIESSILSAECTDGCLERMENKPALKGEVLPSRPSPGSSLNADGFTLVSWNIFKGKKKGWAEDFDKFSRKADILILQEAYLTDQLRGMLTQNNYQWDMTRVFEYRKIASGVLTAARTAPTFSCMFREMEPITRVPKSILITRYPISGNQWDLLVANIHGINFTINQTAFTNQIDHLEMILSSHAGPMVVSGDFNTWSAGRMSHVNAMMQRLGLTAVRFNEKRRARFFGHNVDHMYYRGLEAINATITIVSTSDHNPLTVTFKLADSQ